MSKSIITCLILLLLSLQINYAQREISFGWAAETIQVDNLTRHFTVFIPRECPENAPLIFIFHGGYSGMEKIFNTDDGFNEWPNLAEREKFIIVAPNGISGVTGTTDGENQIWNDCRNDIVNSNDFSDADDVLFTRKLIEWSKEKLAIDEDRIYTAGIGNGGMMVYRLAIEMGDTFAGAAVFFANMPINSSCGEPVKPIPIFIMNSKDDPFIPFNGGFIIGERGQVMSSEETLNYWVSLNQLNTQKRTNKFYEDINPDDNSRIIKNEFDRPLENPHVVFYVITNSGHVVPSLKYSLSDSQLIELLGNQNKDIEGVVEAWKFLRKYTLR